MADVKVAVLISGRGSNLKALLDAARVPAFPAKIALVIANRPQAQGLAHAQAAGVETLVVEHRGFPDRDAFDRAMEREIQRAGCELICLAGFMRLLGADFTERWRDRILNIHPSLLPAFPGLDTHQRVLDAGIRITGCSVHIVRPTVDSGPILIQAAVPVLPDDDAARLADRVLEQEHRIYPLALRWMAEGRVRVVNERTIVDGARAPSPSALVNPSP